MKTINTITTRLSGVTGLLIFFFFLVTSLFLGDGKQPFVDVWWALGILMMYSTAPGYGSPTTRWAGTKDEDF